MKVILRICILVVFASLTAISIPAGHPDCREDCREAFKRERNECMEAFRANRDSGKYKECLEEKKANYDNCIAACK